MQGANDAKNQLLLEKDQEIAIKERLVSELRHQRQSMNSTWGSIGGVGSSTAGHHQVKECSREVSELIRELQQAMLGEFESNDYHISSRQILGDLIQYAKAAEKDYGVPG